MGVVIISLNSVIIFLKSRLLLFKNNGPSIRLLWHFIQRLEKNFQGSFCYYFSWFFCDAGDQTQGLTHARQMLYHWSTPLTSVIFIITNCRGENTGEYTMTRIYNTIKQDGCLFKISIQNQLLQATSKQFFLNFTIYDSNKI